MMLGAYWVENKGLLVRFFALRFTLLRKIHTFAAHPAMVALLNTNY